MRELNLNEIESVNGGNLAAQAQAIYAALLARQQAAEDAYIRAWAQNQNQ
jgi:hypothetical protein